MTIVHSAASGSIPAVDEGPIRVQLSRAKGWRMPANTVKVDRTTKWGNPFLVGETYPIVEADGSGESIGESKMRDTSDAVKAFRPWCEETMEQWGDLEPLRGKNLACWCKLGSPCHADVLLELANAPSASPAGHEGAAVVSKDGE